MDVLQLSTVLLLLASVFSIINLRILKLPQTIGLMVLAIGLSFFILAIGLVFPSVLNSVSSIIKSFDFEILLIDIMLPFLLFAGAISVNVHELLKDKGTILLLATFGVLFSTFAVGTGVYWLVELPIFNLNTLDLSYVDCLLFGSLIAPTDPIAVLAMVKKMNLSLTTETRIAGESLFNDGIGVVIFLTLLSVKKLGIENVTAESIGSLFATEVIGGIALGALIGFLGLKLVKYIENEHIELEVLITLSLVLMVSMVSKQFHFSGVLGVVVMGLFLNQNIDVDKNEVGVQKAMGEYVYKFWHLLDETLNAVLFILIGLEIIPIVQNFDSSYLLVSILTIVLVVVSRGIGVWTPIKFLSFFKTFEKRTALIITWGGLRGGLSIALALNLPDNIGEGKNLILFLTYIVVLFTILVQGLTLKKIVK
ncbi:MAG: sodium:proton antiporter [Flavobacteriaceae bacterium]|jgi:monovalent cation:H+ antiporter, CPA1 family|nr:sodium:proton antiporter [Flavobacteriaceae bacterium]MDO7582121.1 sodium:proton antiporter [Flavobacteriaceae bacterium]MDO7598909.1 sodium:proton antiporter [Flavobacteriaceae bacterium]MDO7602818.1 sodium:proton antiporter [Flavobacteriaceae bacterium]MDO7615859.1 sodium:proton antiporter [Flavobacteriaceae bacterium]